MKGGARPGAGRKKKARAKSKGIQKKSSQELSAIKTEEKSNKHHSYIKVQDHGDGGIETGGVDSQDIFYLGTHDQDLTQRTIEQIVSICFTGNRSSELRVRATNATLAALLEIDPQDSTELMLATQMVTAHNVAMEMARRALLVEGQTDEVVNFNVNRMTKLMRTYTTQMEALNKYRNKGKQQITVKHQHVNVNDGGQAIVGDVKGGG
jgi:hypothetical protein